MWCVYRRGVHIRLQRWRSTGPWYESRWKRIRTGSGFTARKMCSNIGWWFAYRCFVGRWTRFHLGHVSRFSWNNGIELSRLAEIPCANSGRCSHAENRIGRRSFSMSDSRWSGVHMRMCWTRPTGTSGWNIFKSRWSQRQRLFAHTTASIFGTWKKENHCRWCVDRFILYVYSSQRNRDHLCVRPEQLQPIR